MNNSIDLGDICRACMNELKDTSSYDLFNTEDNIFIMFIQCIGIPVNNPNSFHIFIKLHINN